MSSFTAHATITKGMPRWGGPAFQSGAPSIRLVDKHQIDRYAAVLESQSDDESRQKSLALLKAILPLGEYRRLHPLPSNWGDELSELERRFPNFGMVIQHVRANCALSERSGIGHVQVDNLLLSGPPGCGKSYFASHLAAFFRGDFSPKSGICVRMADQQSNSALAGSDSFWANSKPSLLLEALLFDGYGNPTIILDELDKAGGDGRYDPTAPLLTLMDTESAKAWKDLCFPWISVNASLVTWIATCNDHSAISAPILSRMKLFVIAPPTRADSISIAETIVAEVLREHLPDGSIGFDQSALETLASLSPRRQRSAAKNALGLAVYNNNETVRRQDIEFDKAPVRIGFFE